MDDFCLCKVTSPIRESILQIFKGDESNIVENCLEFVSSLAEDSVEFRLDVILYIKKQMGRSKQLVFAQKYLESLSEQFRRENPLFIYELRFIVAFAHIGDETDAEIQKSINEYECIVEDLDKNYPCEPAKCLAEVHLLWLHTWQHDCPHDEYQKLADALEACCEDMRLHSSGANEENYSRRRFMFRALQFMGKLTYRRYKHVYQEIQWQDKSLLFASTVMDKIWGLKSILLSLCNSRDTSENAMAEIQRYWEQFKKIVEEICDNECELSDKFYCAVLLENVNSTSWYLVSHLTASSNDNTHVLLQEEIIKILKMGVELGLKYLGGDNVHVGLAAAKTALFSHQITNKELPEYETIGNQVLKAQQESADSKDERFPLSRFDFQVLSFIYSNFVHLCLRKKHFYETETFLLLFLELSKRYENIYGTCDFFKTVVARFHYKVGKLYLENRRRHFSHCASRAVEHLAKSIEIQKSKKSWKDMKVNEVCKLLDQAQSWAYESPHSSSRPPHQQSIPRPSRREGSSDNFQRRSSCQSINYRPTDLNWRTGKPI